LERGQFAFNQPWFLPDGNHFLVRRVNQAGTQGVIQAGSLDSTGTRTLIEANSNPKYAAGFLFFHRDQSLLAQPFDAGRIQPAGEPFPVVENVAVTPFFSAAAYSVSNNGALLYHTPGMSQKRLAWFNREGKRLGHVGEPAMINQMALSPDGERVVIERTVPPASSRDLWLVELASGIFSRLTFDPANDADAVWSPDSKAVAFSSNRKGANDIYRKVIGSAGEELLLSSNQAKYAEGWLADGSILYLASSRFWLLRPSAAAKPEALVQFEFPRDEPAVSPDGKWVAYGSNESGRWEVYIAAFPSFTRNRQVSSAGGGVPRWRGDGRELFYLAPDAKVMSAAIQPGDTLAAALPQPLFQTPLAFDHRFDLYAPARDGQKFLIIEPVSTESPPIHVILNWSAHLTPR
jgi:hypothetical protein